MPLVFYWWQSCQIASLSLEDIAMMASLSSEDDLMGLQWVDEAVVSKLFEA